MLLRRMMEHVRTQNWFAVLLDFGIVVVGVFIGMQVSNWNGVNQQRQIEDEIIERLHADFTEIVAWASAGRDYVEGLHAHTGPLVDAGAAGFILPEQEEPLLTAINECYDLLITLKTSATYTEIVSSGQVRLIRNDALRQALAGYQASSDESHTAFQALSQAFMRHIDILDSHAIIAPDVASLPVGSNIVVTGYDWAALDDDPRLPATFRFFHNLRSNEYLFFNGLAEEAQAVLTILEEETALRP
ncbi:hypothetical protein FF098_009705 [Parvularcula flava]|uniref:Uncharacterized protein n=1 Tax=Aquisalinus luteolus TaxID=1566827 RepID=A0A8J3ERI9_9PROT|nr:hypothetical protein [Aquisalinus luteolus]NHK28177.1 hypothetical protein [Aquisalinus luteolus]GGH97696.1 hypothetical protein GCM10011355_19540 [Aquisalinus luteolus]